MHINVYQTKQVLEQNVNSDLLEKLYNLIIQDDRTHNVFDNATELIGNIAVGYSYRKYIEAVNRKFPNLDITTLGIYILFEDPVVEQILINTYTPGADGILESLELNRNDAFNKNGQIFYNNQNITSFNELPQLERATKLGNNAFELCQNLESINLSEVTSIGARCFRLCSSLAINVNAPKLTSIQYSAFNNSGITSISNIGSVTTLPDSIFSECKSLISVNDDAFNQVKVIEYNAFGWCTELLSLGSLASVTTIGTYAFNNCQSLTNLSFESVTTIGGCAFQNCFSLETVTGLENLTEIQNHVFNGCLSLRSIGNTPNLTKIGDDAFSGCGLFGSIDLPTTITTIGNSAFSGCNSLEINDINLPNLELLGSYAFQNTKVKKLSSLGDLTEIQNNAFQGCTSLTTANINALSNVEIFGTNSFQGSAIPQANLLSVKQLKDACFYNCKQLTTVGSLPTTVTEIGNSAFSYCESLVMEDLNVPNLTRIGYYAFEKVKLKKISSIGSTITSLPERIWLNCTELTQVDNDALQYIQVFENNEFNGCSKLTRVGSIQSARIIKGGCFGNCPLLASIDLPESIVELGNSVFDNDTLLVINDINLPNLTSIGYYVFCKTKVKKISSIGSTITVLPERIWMECKDLTAVYNNALQYIVTFNNNMFSTCTSLTTVGNLTNCTRLEGNVFYNCSLLEYVGLTSAIEYIGGSCFAGCSSLTNIGTYDLSNLTYIGGWAFRGCTALTGTYDFGSNITSIDEFTFTNCNFNIILRNTTMPTINSRAFENFNGNLYVPNNLVDTYKSTFTSISSKIFSINSL